MKNKRIELEDLLNKFDLGQTAFNEELRIKKLLEEVNSEKYHFYAQYFQAVEEAKGQKDPESIIDFSFIDQEKKTQLKDKDGVYTWKVFLKVAAVVAILIGSLFFGKLQQTKLKQAKAELAFEQTVQALNLVGSKMNTAKEKVNYIEIYNEKTKPYINLNQN